MAHLSAGLAVESLGRTCTGRRDAQAGPGAVDLTAAGRALAQPRQGESLRRTRHLGRPASWRPRPAPGLAVVLGHRRGRRPSLAGVPAPLRSGARPSGWSSRPQGWVLPSEAPRPGGGGPVDVAGHRSSRPAAPVPAPRSRPAPTWEKPADSSERPARKPTRLEEPAPRHPLRRGQRQEAPKASPNATNSDAEHRFQKGTVSPDSRNRSSALPMHSATKAPSALIPPSNGPPEAANVHAG